MSRINTNVPSLIGQRVLVNNSLDLNRSLERLSTGLRINRGKDDPAGLIASENLRAEKTSLNAAIANSERADQVVNIAEGGLQEITNLLNELQGLVTQTANTAGLSKEELVANQLQIDSILQTIDRIASATSFQGLKLLNGNFDYQTTDVSAVVASYKVNGAKLGFGETRDVEVLVTTSAQIGGFFLSFGATQIDLSAATNQFVVDIAGSRGSRQLSFASGTDLSEIAAAINSFTEVTGVEATVSGTGLRIISDAFGSTEFVSVKVADDGGIGTASGIGIYDFEADDTNTADTAITSTFIGATNAVTDNGQDVQATVNGIVATTDGTVVRINTDFLDVEIDLGYDEASTNPNAAVLGAISGFTITGGGANFQLAGQVDISGRVSLGIQNVAVRNLGRSTELATGIVSYLADLGTGRELNVVDGDRVQSQRVVDASIREITSLRGRLGAFQKNTIGATIRSLGISLENTTAAESVIRDTEFAEETASLTRGQILSSSAIQVLAIANSQPQAALQLLG